MKRVISGRVSSYSSLRGSTALSALPIVLGVRSAQRHYQIKRRVRVLQLDRFVETESVCLSVKAPVAVDS